MDSIGTSNSIILTGSRIDTGEKKQKMESYMDNIFQYKVGTGWINLGLDGAIGDFADPL